jgi:N6-L-threonylcarbamoyladenine synthase
VGRFHLLGSTIDDAAGEAFDKTAKLLGLPYPGGPNIEALAREGNACTFALPRPMVGRERADFSFSGLKTAVRQIVRGPEFKPTSQANLAASFQAAVIDSLLDRTGVAMEQFRQQWTTPNPVLVVAGGVAANGAIRAALEELAEQRGFAMRVPPPALCTDNAAMIAWAGVERAELQLFDALEVPPRARWPLADLRDTRPIAS